MANRPFTFISTPTIREAARADAAALSALMGELGYPVSPEVLWARIEAMPASSHCTLVAEISGIVAGFVGCSALAIYESDLPTCWVMALAVRSSFRRHGVGRALLQAVERWSTDHGLPDIRVHSGDARGEAHAFYEACGYQRAGFRFKRLVASPPASSEGATDHPAA